MSDGAPRLASLSVIGGPLHGKRVDLAGVDEVTIGSDPDCSLVIELPGVSPLHAKVWVDMEGAKVIDTRSPSGVFVNMDRVVGERPLREGDTVWLGPPEEPGSVLLQCRFGRAAPDAEAPVALSAEAFQTMASPPAAASTPPDASDFVVAGFDAQWPETTGPPPPAAAPPPPSPPPREPARAAAPTAPAGAEEDPFFIGEGADVPPPAAPAAAKDDSFFIDDFAAAPQAPKPPPPLPSPAAPPPPAPVDDFFFEEGEKPAVPAFAPFVDEAPFEIKPLTDVGVPKPAPPPQPVAQAPPAAPAPVAPAPVAASPVAPAPGAPAAPAAAPPSTPAPVARPAAPAPKPATTPSAPAATRRTEGAPARRPAGARPATARPSARPASRKASGPSPLVRYAGYGIGGLAALGLLGFLAMRFLGGSVRLDSAEPARGRAGTTVTLTGSGFAEDPKGNTVTFGDAPAAVASASATRLEVAVPEVAVVGDESKVQIQVRAGRGASNPVDFSVLGGPTIHGISPDVAMPGEEVVLAGSGFGMGAAVRFGASPAEVIEIRDTSIRARVPPIAGGAGTAAPAVVSMGASSSNELPFFIGSIPLVLGIAPATAAPGDVITVSGRGFQRERTRNAVLVAGTFGLVVSAADGELKVVVPTLAPGEPVRPVEVRVAGLANVGRATLTVPPLPESVELHLVPQPFDAVAGRSYAVLATDLGPAFVLAGSGTRSAAERAVEAQRRFDDAVTAIKATRGLNFEARALDTSPVIGLEGRPEVVLEVSDEDARAYDEDWTGLKGRGGPVTKARLARWWEAVAKDLVLLLVRGERPQFAAAVAPEGRVLLDVYQAAQKTGRFGVAREVVAGAASAPARGAAAHRAPRPGGDHRSGGGCRCRRSGGRGSRGGHARPREHGLASRRRLARQRGRGGGDALRHRDVPLRRRQGRLRGKRHADRALPHPRDSPAGDGEVEPAVQGHDPLLHGQVGRAGASGELLSRPVGGQPRRDLRAPSALSARARAVRRS